MVKCPNCGSTAQVRCIGGPFLSDNKRILSENFNCGCGAHFEVDYERNDESYWEVSEIFIHFIKKVK